MSGNVSMHGVDSINTLSNGKVKWVPIGVIDESLKIASTNLPGYSAGAAITAGVTQTLWQLWNPLGSGVNLVIDTMSLECSTSCNIQVYNTDAALTTPVTGTIGNQNFGGTAGAGLLYEDADVVETGTIVSQIRLRLNIPTEVNSVRGITIPPGAGCTFRAIVGAIVYMDMTWDEVAVA